MNDGPKTWMLSPINLLEGIYFREGSCLAAVGFSIGFFDLMNDTVNKDKPEINNWHQAKLCIVCNYEMINSACHLDLQRAV